MKQKILSISILFGVLASLLVSPAHATTDWPQQGPSVLTNLYDSSSAVTNTAGPVFLSAGNTGGVSIDTVHLVFEEFNTGITSQNNPTVLSPSVAPQGINVLSLSQSGSVVVGVALSSGATGSIDAYQWQRAGISTTLVIGFDTPLQGMVGFEMSTGTLESNATSEIKRIKVVGFSSGAQVYQLIQSWPSSGGGGTPPGSGDTPTPAPAKYSGPEFSGLSAKGVMTGTSPRLEGKNLDEISSIEIGGKAATFTLDGDKALELTLPAGLAPGLYDLVINSSAGKLTHINAIQVREPKKSFSITTRSVAKISSDQYLEHSLIASMQIPELNKVRCIVNASSLSLAKMMADRLCAVVKASNPNIETTVVVPRSTVSGDTVFARVIYGWN